MIKFIAVLLLAILPSVVLAKKKPSSIARDRIIAKAAFEYAKSRLMANPEDEKGWLMQGFAAALLTTDNVLYFKNLLKAGALQKSKKKAKPIDQIISMMLKQADSLYKRSVSSNSKCARLCYLYYLVLDKLKPGQEPVIVGLFKLKSRGLDETLDDFDAGSINLIKIYKKPIKPDFGNMLTSKADRWIAYQSGILAQNRVAAKVDKETGLMLLAFCLKLEPANDGALNLIARIQSNIKLTRTKSKYSETFFFKRLISQGKIYLKKMSKNSKYEKICLLYYKLAELLQPDDHQVIIGLTRLKAAGLESDLVSVLNSDAFDKPKPVRKIAKVKTVELTDDRAEEIVEEVDEIVEVVVEETVEKKADIAPKKATDASPLLFGTIGWDPKGANFPDSSHTFTGDLDEFRLTNGALSAASIKKYAARPKPFPYTQNTLALWRFNDKGEIANEHKLKELALRECYV